MKSIDQLAVRSSNIGEKDSSEIRHSGDNVETVFEFFDSRRDLLDDEVLRRDYFEQQSEEDFLDHLQQLASLIRAGDSTQQQHFDGADVGLFMHDVPDQREKESLLRATWQTAQIFLHDRSLEDSVALEYAGLTVATGVLYVHPFGDGNGRTARLLSYEMMEGALEREDAERLLADDGDAEWRVRPMPGEFWKREGILPRKVKRDDADTSDNSVAKVVSESLAVRKANADNILRYLELLGSRDEITTHEFFKMMIANGNRRPERFKHRADVIAQRLGSHGVGLVERTPLVEQNRTRHHAESKMRRQKNH